jgi:hypothetical protein
VRLAAKAGEAAVSDAGEMNPAKQIERDLVAALKGKGFSVTAALQRQCQSVANDMAMADRIRDEINAGNAVDLDGFMKLRAAADASKAALMGMPGPVTDRIEIELIGSPHRQSRLEAENRELRAELEAIKAAVGRQDSQMPAGAESGQVSVPDPVASEGPSTASPSQNVIPLETADQRRARIIAENRRKAGDRPMPLSQRSAFTESVMLSGEGSFPFDFPSNRGGW